MRAVMPIHVPTQIIADANSSSSTSAASDVERRRCATRQPTTRPVSEQHDDRRAIMPASSATKWPDQIGRARGRQRAEAVDHALRSRSVAIDSRRAHRGRTRASGRGCRRSGTRGSCRRRRAIAPPNTNANSSTNMIGWSVTSSSFSGIWRMCSTLRPRNERVAPERRRWRSRAGRAGVGRAWSGRCGHDVVIGGRCRASLGGDSALGR